MTTNLQQNQNEDLSYETLETLDSLPKVWIRGLLYFMLIFLATVLPWSMISKVDETGTAKGKLEPQGGISKLDSEVGGKVTAINFKEGDFVQKGETLLTLDPESLQTELQQVYKKIEGLESKSDKMKEVKEQLKKSRQNQAQQNSSQLLEKEAQIEQIEQNLTRLKNDYNLQSEKNKSQVEQVKSEIGKSENNSKKLKIELDSAAKDFKIYSDLIKKGAIARNVGNEKEKTKKISQEMYEQSLKDIKQNQARLNEFQKDYELKMNQLKGDIKQTELRLKEQNNNYESLKKSHQLALSKIDEDLKKVESEINNIEVEIKQTKTEINRLNLEIEKHNIKARESGIIFQLPVKKPGEFIPQGARVADIAPKGMKLILRGIILTNESASLKKGLPVKLKFDAYPFQDYGVVEGKLINYSPTSKKIDSAGQSEGYELEIELNKNCISKGNECIKLSPGATANAEIIIRQRRVIDFVLDPFKQLQKDGLKL